MISQEDRLECITPVTHDFRVVVADCKNGVRLHCQKCLVQSPTQHNGSLTDLNLLAMCSPACVA